jgi:hypothetical protein
VQRRDEAFCHITRRKTQWIHRIKA